MDYGNLSFNTENLREIIKGRLYELYCDEDLLNVNSLSDVKRLEEIALIIIRKYIDSWYKRQQQEWEYRQLEYHPLSEDNKNIRHYADMEPGCQLDVKKTAVGKSEEETEA